MFQRSAAIGVKMFDIDKYLKTHEHVKLDIGSGGYPSDPSFLGVDAFVETDIQAFMWDLPLPDNSVDFIFTSQAMEHLSKFEVVPTLREWNRVLKVGSAVQMILPDLEWCVWWWLTHQTVDWDLDIIFGNQKHEGEFHKTGFTPTIIKKYLDVAGGYSINKIEYFGGEYTNLTFRPDDSVRGKIIGRCINVEAFKIEAGVTNYPGKPESPAQRPIPTT